MNPAKPDGPDLQGLQPSYTAAISKTLRWVVSIAFGLIAVSAVLRLLDDPEGFDIGLSIIQIAFYSLWLAAVLVLPPAVYLDQDGLRLRKFLRWGRVIPWQRVTDIRVQGRWQDVSVAALDNGKSERLVGMPVDDAQTLAVSLAEWRASAGGH